MFAKSLLLKAKKAKTPVEQRVFLKSFINCFTKEFGLRLLLVRNCECHGDGQGFFSRFDLMRVIADRYVTSISPEIRDGALMVFVATSVIHGIGTESENAELIEGMNDQFVVAFDQDISEAIKHAVKLAVGHHQMLIESVGVAAPLARQVAAESW